jgi:predicted metal-binding membrane protein
LSLPRPVADEVDRFAWLRPTPSLRGVWLSLLVILMLLTAAAWAVTLYETRAMDVPMGIAARGAAADAIDGMAMGGMAIGGASAARWSFMGAGIFVTIWTVMMAAMMLPATAPMILIFATAQARRVSAAAVPTSIFVAGYLLVWMVAGLFVYALIEIGSELAAGVGAADRVQWAPIALGGTIAAAGLYQFTPIKRICLRHCRSPFAFVAQNWRDGRLGALKMGIQHGSYCFGCCWALFAVLVAAGAMSLAWMLLLTLVVFVEKALPQGRLSAAVLGIALVAVGLLVASGAIAMPWPT